jgi:class 3 adenylate cyclase
MADRRVWAENCGVPAEERKLATILFADLVGSIELAGSQDPERVRALLDRFYDAMAAEVGRAGGTVEKFVGDAVMAAFGAPVAHEDDAERALHVALGMQRRLGELFGGRLALPSASSSASLSSWPASASHSATARHPGTPASIARQTGNPSHPTA